jgi:hypothetical protein
MITKLRLMTTMLLLSALIMFPTRVQAKWVLPIADGSDVEPSLPSVQGYLVSVTNNEITLKRDSSDGKMKDTVIVRLMPRTEFFSAYGGFYTSNELRSGQYVWVWYVSEDPKKAGTPPQAAVVMLWSTDPSDKPTEEIRWHFEKKSDGRVERTDTQR